MIEVVDSYKKFIWVFKNFLEQKQWKGVVSMFLWILTASILGNILTLKGVIRIGEGLIKTGQTLTDFKIQRYYLDEPKFNSVYLKNNSSEIKDGEYIINIDES